MIRAYSAEECLNSVNNTSGRTTSRRRKGHVFEDFMAWIPRTRNWLIPNAYTRVVNDLKRECVLK
jgi:hypothetical protein